MVHVTHPPTLTFQNFLATSTFAAQQKRANIVPIRKKNDKKNYQTFDQYLFCLYVVKFLKNFFSTNFSNS